MTMITVQNGAIFSPGTVYLLGISLARVIDGSPAVLIDRQGLFRSEWL